MRICSDGWNFQLIIAIFSVLGRFYEEIGIGKRVEYIKLHKRA